MDDQKRETNRSFSDIKMNWDAVRSFVSGVKTRKEEKDKLPYYNRCNSAVTVMWE